MIDRFKQSDRLLLTSFICATAFAADLAGQRVPLPQGEAAGAEFTELVSIRELTDGSVLTVDRGVNRLFHYDWVAGRVNEIGTRGRGPLEYEYAGRLYAVGPDSTLFTDNRKRWNLLVGARIVSTLSENRRLNQFLGGKLSGGDHHGYILGDQGFRYSGRSRLAGSADSVLLLRAEWKTETLDTVAKLKGSGQAGFIRLPATAQRPPALVGGNPLDSEEQGLLFSDGAIAVARLGPYRVDWRLPNGAWVRGEPLPFEARPVTHDVRCAALRAYLGMSGHCDPGILPGWPETVPPFLRLRTTPVLMGTPEGRLVVARTAVGQENRRYDVIDRTGDLVGILTLPPDEFVLGFGTRSVYIVKVDEWGLQTLRRHPWN